MLMLMLMLVLMLMLMLMLMYKIYGKRKLEFKDDMYVKPFLLKERGDIDGILMKGGTVAEYHMHYSLKQDFTLVVGVEKEVVVLETL